MLASRVPCAAAECSQVVLRGDGGGSIEWSGVLGRSAVIQRPELGRLLHFVIPPLVAVLHRSRAPLASRTGLTQFAGMLALRSILMLVLLALSAACAEAAELLMFEEPGCVWCRRWHAEIGPGYPHSTEGRIAPLRRVDIRNGLPSDVHFEQNVTMTPTFVLVDNGEERGRLVGYSGADFFYPMLDRLLQRLVPARDPAAGAGMVKTSAGQVSGR